MGILWDGADLINAMWYKAEGNDFMAGVCLLSALPMLGSFAGGTLKAVATGTKYLNKAETVAKYLTLGTKFISHTAQATMSGIDTYYAAVDAYEAYKAGELGAEEILNLGLAATGAVLSTGAAISSGRGLYNLMCSDGVGCKVLTGITGEPHCFVAGTLVSTEDGQRTIEEVEAGDKVWAYDEETGGKALKEVEEVFVSETDKLIHVETDKEEIITTELHPFYVEGLGFVQAGCLQEGYELVCLDGGKETITDVRVEWLEEAVEVYNFEVADYHTYFVGDGDVLVHNTTCANPSGDDGLVVNGSSKFKDGDLFEDFIKIGDMEINCIAEIKINGKQLILKDIAIYSNQGDMPNKIGMVELKRWLTAVGKSAQSEGFESLRIMGERVAHSTSANPGMKIDHTFSLIGGK